MAINSFNTNFLGDEDPFISYFDVQKKATRLLMGFDPSP